MADATRDRLIRAAVEVLAQDGIAATSARSIGARADANPALIYYHFESLTGLLVAAAREVATERAAAYRTRLAEVSTLTQLAAAGRALHAEEHASGNLAMLAQLLAASRTHPELGPVLQENFALLAAEVAEVLERILSGTPLDGVLDPNQLARTVSASFIGIELLDSVADDAADPFASLDTFATVVDHALQAGTISTSLLRRRVRAAIAESPRG